MPAEKMPKQASTTIKPSSRAIRLGSDKYHTIDSTALTTEEGGLTAQLPLPPGIDQVAADADGGDGSSPSRHMPVPHHAELGLAKEEDIGDAVFRPEDTSAASYARELLLTCAAKLSELAAMFSQNG